MQIDIIDKTLAFEAIKANWQDVYRRDSLAQFFISWNWISTKIKELNQRQIPWLILAAKVNSNASDYVGFLPLTIETDKYEQAIFFYNELALLGRGDAEHPGYLSLPESEAEVAKSLANYLQQLDFWSIFSLSGVPQASDRLNLLLANFDSASFQTQEDLTENYHNPLDLVNNQIVPYVALPDSWSQYLQDSLSSNTRQKIRRFLRKIENSAEFSITKVNGSNLEQHIEILSQLWRASWSSRKGDKECNDILHYMALELRQCFEYGCLRLPVLWQADKPLAAVANLIDFEKKTVSFLIGGRDETFRKFAPGFVLHADAIRSAIAQGFKIYDFLIGNEAYKYSFGAQERYIQTMTVERQNWKQQARKLSERSLPVLLRMSQYSHHTNDLPHAEAGYRQVLEIQPEHAQALYGLSAIAQRQGKEEDAEKLLDRLLEIEPNNIKAWFGLGTLHLTHERLSSAEKAYRQALSYQPNEKMAMAIYHNLGYALQQQNKLDEAIDYYKKARELQPDSIEAEVLWANALHLQSKLSPEQQLHYAQVNLHLGRKRRQANDLQVAQEYYRQATTLNPDLAEAHYYLGRLLQTEADNWSEAIACYQTVLKIQPDLILADVAIANIHYAQDKLSPEQQLKYSLLNNNVGNQYLQANDLQIASEHYRQAITLNPDLAEAYYGLALALHRQSPNNLEESITYYQKALVLKPDFELATVALANALHTQNRLSPEQQIEYATASCSLADKYIKAGNFKLAIEYYEFAVSLNSELTEARQNLRLAMEQIEERTIKVSSAKS